MNTKNLKRFDEFLSKELRKLQTKLASEISNEVMIGDKHFSLILNSRKELFEEHQHIRLWMIACIIRRAVNALYSAYDEHDYEKSEAIAKNIKRLLSEFNNITSTMWGSKVPLAALAFGDKWIKKQVPVRIQDIFKE